MRIALAYSGGLDTSVIIPWLKEHYDAEVIAVTVNVGQREDFNVLQEKAFQSGASEVWMPDCREEFVDHFVFPLLSAGSRYEESYLLGTAMARPLIASKLVEAAERYGAEAVAHGATGKGNDQVRFEVGVMALNPQLTIIAPWRLWNLKGRQDEMAYAARHHIPVDSTPESPYSRDENLWHVSHEGGVLEDPASRVPEEVYTWTTQPEMAPDQSEVVDITFDQGQPKAIDGQLLSGANLVEVLNQKGGRHGVGRVTLVENRLVGIKSRGVYETPGGTILYAAHQALTTLTWDRELAAYMHDVGRKLARLVYDGLWFSPLTRILKAAAAEANGSVSGIVTMKLFKGQATVEAIREVPESLYSEELATFEQSQFSHQDAAGFIRLWGLPSQTQGLANRKLVDV